MKFQIASIVAAAVAAVGLTLGSVDTRAAQKDIVETAVDAGKFKTLAAALGAADLVDTLKGAVPSRYSRRPMRPSRSFLRAPSRTFKAREQGSACRNPHLPRGAGESDGG